MHNNKQLSKNHNPISSYYTHSAYTKKKNKKYGATSSQEGRQKRYNRASSDKEHGGSIRYSGIAYLGVVYRNGVIIGEVVRQTT